MQNKEHKITEKKDSFDYESFEVSTISGIRSGAPFLGSDGLLKDLLSYLVNAALSGEMEAHLAQEKSEGKMGNRRNGYTEKTVRSDLGALTIHPPRDRSGSFEPMLIEKWNRDLGSGLDPQILELYGQGQSIAQIQGYLERMYGVGLSAGQISAITDKVWESVTAWKTRVLEACYVLIYLDGIYFRIRENEKVVTKAIYTAYGVTVDGERDILDIHVGYAEKEGAKEWGRLLERLQARGVEDVLFFAVDGLEGFSEAIYEVYPDATVQRCIVHMVRTCLKLVDQKDYSAICKDLRAIYAAIDQQAGELALERFEQKWDERYPEIGKKWRAEWLELTAFWGYNHAVRRLIYTTNAIEGLHRKMRAVTKNKGAFINEKALLKLLYLNLIYHPNAWRKKVHGWIEIRRSLNREFGRRFSKHLKRKTLII